MSLTTWKIFSSAAVLVTLVSVLQVRGQSLNGVPVVTDEQISSLQECLGVDAVARVQRSLTRWQEPCQDVWNSPVWNRRRLQLQDTGRQWEEVLWQLVFREDLSDDGGPVSPVPCIPLENSTTSNQATVSSSAATSTSTPNPPSGRPPLPVTPFTSSVSTASSTISATSSTVTQSITTSASTTSSTMTTATSSAGTTGGLVTPFTLPTSTSTPSPSSTSTTEPTSFTSTTTTSSSTTATSSTQSTSSTSTEFQNPSTTSTTGRTTVPSTTTTSSSTTISSTSTNPTSTDFQNSSPTSSSSSQAAFTTTSSEPTSASLPSSSPASSSTGQSEFASTASTSTTRTTISTQTVSLISLFTTTLSSTSTTVSQSLPTTSTESSSSSTASFSVEPPALTTTQSILTSLNSQTTNFLSSTTRIGTSQTVSTVNPQLTTQQQTSNPGGGSGTDGGGNGGSGTGGGTGGSYGGVDPPSVTGTSSTEGPMNNLGTDRATDPSMVSSQTMIPRTTNFPSVSFPSSNHNGTGGGTGGSYGGTLPNGNYPGYPNPYGWSISWNNPWAYGHIPRRQHWDFGHNPRMRFPPIIISGHPPPPWFNPNQIRPPFQTPLNIKGRKAGRWFWVDGRLYFEPSQTVLHESEVGHQFPYFVPPPPYLPPPFPLPPLGFPPYGIPWPYPPPTPYGNFHPIYPQVVPSFYPKTPTMNRNASFSSNETFPENLACNTSSPILVWFRHPHFHIPRNPFVRKFFHNHYHWHIYKGPWCPKNISLNSNTTQLYERIVKEFVLKSVQASNDSLHFTESNTVPPSGTLRLTDDTEQFDINNKMASVELSSLRYNNIPIRQETGWGSGDSKGTENQRPDNPFLTSNYGARYRNIPQVVNYGVDDVFHFIEFSSELMLSNEEVIPEEEFFKWLNYRTSIYMPLYEEPWTEHDTEVVSDDDDGGRSMTHDSMESLRLENDMTFARQAAVQSTPEEVFVAGCGLRGAGYLTENDEINMVALNQTLNSFAIPAALELILLQNRRTCVEYSDSIVVEQLTYPLHNELGRQLAFFECLLQEVLSSCDTFQQLQEALGGTQ